jgi:imidazoleglycerol-phosphate dehydratase
MTRNAEIHRKTRETDIQLALNLDGTGSAEIRTGVGFLDHMLHHVAVHGLFDLTVTAQGDLHIDAHHTIEDVAIVLGDAIDRAVGDRKAITRIGHSFVPMDESLARVVVDLSGRGYAVFEGDFHTPMLGAFPTSLIAHFFETLAQRAKMNLHAQVLYGRDDHHKAEALFKALGRALQMAVARDERRGETSTKGTLNG